MQPGMLVFPLLAAMALGQSKEAPAPATPASDSGEKELVGTFTKLLNDYYEAVRTREMPRVEQALAPTFAHFGSASPGAYVSRPDWLEVLAKRYELASYKVRDITVRCVPAPDRCDVASVSFVAEIKAKIGGVDRSGDFWTVDAWAKSDGNWKLVSRYTAPQEKRKGAAKK